MTNTSLKRRRKAAVRDFGDTMSAAHDLIGEAATATGANASDIRARAAAKLAAAKSKLDQLQEGAISRAKGVARVTDGYVRDNPWQAMGAAAAVGLLAGVFVSRR